MSVSNKELCAGLPQSYTSKISTKTILDRIYAIYPSAAIFTVVPGYPAPQSQPITYSLNQIQSEPTATPPSTSEGLASDDVTSHSETTSMDDLPPLLSSVFNQDSIDWSAEDITNACNDAFEAIVITQAQANNLLVLTVDQSMSDLWFNHRIGRITASQMHNVLRYTGRRYPESIVRTIMQYTQLNSYLPALTWGREKESVAREEYVSQLKYSHTNFESRIPGLIINPGYPYMAATPDGISSCECCGQRLLEIKCPGIHIHLIDHLQVKKL